MKKGPRVLNGGALVVVGKDRDGYFMVMNSGRRNDVVRLREEQGGVWCTLPRTSLPVEVIFSDPPDKKSRT